MYAVVPANAGPITAGRNELGKASTTASYQQGHGDGPCVRRDDTCYVAESAPSRLLQRRRKILDQIIRMLDPAEKRIKPSLMPSSARASGVNR